jgi:hypothetical protein
VIINLILGMVCLQSLLALVLSTLNPRVGGEIDKATRTFKVQGLSLGCLFAVLGATVVGLWTWYAVEVQDWRFAAIVWFPFTVSYLGQWARKVQRRSES